MRIERLPSLLAIAIADLRIVPASPDPASDVADVLGTATIAIGDEVPHGFERIDLSLARLVASLRETRIALGTEGASHDWLLPDGTGRGLRLERRGDDVLAATLASPWERGRDPSGEPSERAFRFESIASTLSALEASVRDELVRTAPHDAARWCASAFGTGEADVASAGVPDAGVPPIATSPDRADPARAPRIAPPTRRSNAKIALVIVASVLGLCLVGGLAIGLVARQVAKSFELGYEPTGLVPGTRDGVPVLVHPHLGFAIRHPGDDFVRSPETEERAARAARGSRGRAEWVAYVDGEQRNVLFVAIERLPLEVPTSLEMASRNASAEYTRAGDTKRFEGFRTVGSHRTFEASFESGGVYTLVGMRIVHGPEGAPYCVLVSASGPYPEAFLPVFDSFAERGEPLGHPRTLDDERARWPSRLDRPAPASGEAPEAPPPGVPFDLVRYASGETALHAYLSRDPGDGARHPALLFAHGGFDGIGRDCWEGPARDYLAAGFVVMCPSWRGEAGNPGRFELFYGELDDARAALAHVRRLPYVDPDRVYVMGHSTGGTLALLLAASTDGIRAAVSIGGAPDVEAWATPDPEDPTFPPYDATRHEEAYVRSALGFVGDLRAPTFYVEGEDGVAHPELLAAMERAASASRFPLRTALVPGYDHFDVRDPALALFLPHVVADANDGRGIGLDREAMIAGIPAPSAPEEE